MRRPFLAAFLGIQAAVAQAQTGLDSIVLGCWDMGCEGPRASICYRAPVGFGVGWTDGFEDPWLRKDSGALPVRDLTVEREDGETTIRLVAGTPGGPGWQGSGGYVRVILHDFGDPALEHLRMVHMAGGVVRLTIEHLGENGEVEGLTTGNCTYKAQQGEQSWSR